MITLVLSIILFLIFTALGGIHFYWVFGGKWAVEKVIPTKTDAPNTASIPPIATVVVGLALLSAGFLYLLKSGLITVPLPGWITSLGYWFIPVLFILRAIGEFKYVGFFKSIKDTEFAKADSSIFSPLCLGIGVIGIILLFV